jgi:hypothetical protein
MDKNKLKQELAKALKSEMTGTGTGASVTPGVGMGVATKYAFKKKVDEDAPQLAAGKVKDNYAVSHFGFKDTPSIPNRPSKAMDYKELWEDFKVGDKVTYLGHPGEITAVNKEMSGDITYNVLYDKGTGKTKVTNVWNKGGEIKPLKEDNSTDEILTYLQAAKQQGKLSPDAQKVLIQWMNSPGASREEIIKVLRQLTGVYLKEAPGFKSGKEFINIKLQKYPKALAKVNNLISMIGENNFTMDMAEWIFDFFNNASFESPISEESLLEGYAQFRNETKMRSKPDQFHQAVKSVKKKMSEINRLFEYMDRLKKELSEGEELKHKKYTENALQQIKESAKALFFKSTKLK